MGIKKTCVGCYSVECYSPEMGHYHGSKDHPEHMTGCILGYENYKGAPLEECPKPKSWKALDRAPKKGGNHGKA